MKNQIIYLEEKNYKVFGFDENLILASSKRHENFDSILASAEKSGMLENFKKIEMSKLKSLKIKEEGEILKFHFINTKGKNKSTGFNFSIPGSRLKVAQTIAELKGFERIEKEETKTKPLLLNTLGLLSTIIGTFLFCWISNESGAGVEYEASGRRKASNEFIYDLLGKIGPEIIIGGGVILFCWLTYKTYQRYQNPHTETVFK